MDKFLVLLLSLLACSVQAAPTILVFGDSLSAGYGMAVEQSWPALLEQRLRAEKFPHTVINASISGETTAGGQSRLPAALARFRPTVVVLALGANDGLRGLPLDQTRSHLTAMIHAAQRAGARVLLVGMRLPPNYGPDYAQGFAAMFRELAKREQVALLPFLLEPIALDATAFQPDGLHPTAAAQAKLLEHVWAHLMPLLKPR